MTRDQIIADLYERATSRKLWLCLMSIAFAAWSYHNGALTGEQFQQAVMVAVTAYTGAEALTDAVAAYRPKTAGPEQTVNVSTEPVDTPPKPAPKRVRPSRAKPKAGAV